MAITGIKREQNRYAAFLLTPALLVIVLFTSIPALTTLSYAFFRWKGFQRQGFAGFENFERLFNDPFKSYFYMALRHNVLVFVAILIILRELKFSDTIILIFSLVLYLVLKNYQYNLNMEIYWGLYCYYKFHFYNCL